MKKKLVSLVLASSMVLSLAACGAQDNGGAATTDTQTATTDSQTAETTTTTDAAQTEAPAAEPAGEQKINVCLASEPASLDPALNSAVDGATLINHLFSGLAKWGQDASGNLELQPDCAEELVEGVTNDDGTVTYTYTLRDGLTW